MVTDNKIEIFNNYEKRTISSPLSFLKFDNDKLKNDVLRSFKVDLDDKKSFNYRYVITRLFWFLLIHYANKTQYPNIHKLLSKLTNQTLLVSIRSLAESQYDFYYPDKNDFEMHMTEWYQLLKSKLNCGHGGGLELPDTISAAGSAIDILTHMNTLENTINLEFIEDENISITLRGLYNSTNSYISMGIIVPLNIDYITYIDRFIDVNIKESLSTYIQYSKSILDNYIEKTKMIKTISTKYCIHYPVSIPYNTILSSMGSSSTSLSFTISEPYKSLELLEKDPSYGISDVKVTCFLVDNIGELYLNEENHPYDVIITTSKPEHIINYLKIKDSLPESFYIKPLDLVNPSFYTMVDKIKSYSIK